MSNESQQAPEHAAQAPSASTSAASQRSRIGLGAVVAGAQGYDAQVQRLAPGGYRSEPRGGKGAGAQGKLGAVDASGGVDRAAAPQGSKAPGATDEGARDAAPQAPGATNDGAREGAPDVAQDAAAAGEVAAEAQVSAAVQEGTDVAPAAPRPARPSGSGVAAVYDWALGSGVANAEALGGPDGASVLQAADSAVVARAIASVPASCDAGNVPPGGREGRLADSGETGSVEHSPGGEGAPEIHLNGRVQGGERRASWAARLDWSQPAPGGFAGLSLGSAPGTQPAAPDVTMAAQFRMNRDARLAQTFGPNVSAIAVLQAQRVAEALGHSGVASAIAARLAQVNQYAVVDTLNVEGSTRYQKTASGMTFCDAYAYDVITALGGYLPRVWWTPRALVRIREGAQVVTPEVFEAANGRQRQGMITPIPGQTVGTTGANRVNQWLREDGPAYGWTPIEAATPNEKAQAAQMAANEGKLVIGSAAGVRRRRSPVPGAGHISVVLAESQEANAQEGRGGPDDGRVHRSGADANAGYAHGTTDGVYNVLESNAGVHNFAYASRRNGSTPGAETTSSEHWWNNPQHTNGGFWVYDQSRRNSPIPAPGLGAP